MKHGKRLVLTLGMVFPSAKGQLQGNLTFLSLQIQAVNRKRERKKKKLNWTSGTGHDNPRTKRQFTQQEHSNGYSS